MLEHKLRICKLTASTQKTLFLTGINRLILSFLDEIEADLVAVSHRRQNEVNADAIDSIATFWTVARALRVIVYARMFSPATVSSSIALLPPTNVRYLGYY